MNVLRWHVTRCERGYVRVTINNALSVPFNIFEVGEDNIEWWDEGKDGEIAICDLSDKMTVEEEEVYLQVIDDGEEFDLDKVGDANGHELVNATTEIADAKGRWFRFTEQARCMSKRIYRSALENG